MVVVVVQYVTYVVHGIHDTYRQNVYEKFKFFFLPP